MTVAERAHGAVLEAIDVAKSYRGGDGATLSILDGVNLSVARGEMIAVVGASGAGKSTLLHVLGVLDRPTRGEVRIGGQTVIRAGGASADEVAGRARGSASPLARYRRRQARRAAARVLQRSDEVLARLRNRNVGFVFQFHHLLREFSALENVMMPLRIGGVSDADARDRAAELLRRVGLASRMLHRPSELSGGEQQRAAVARALAADPAVLLADEPSGNLDQMNAERLHALFAELARDLELGMVVVTHNRSLAGRADRALLLEDGRLVDTDVREVVT